MTLPPPARPRPPRRLVRPAIALSLALATAAIAVVLAWRWWTAIPVLPPLEAGWDAVVSTLSRTPDSARFADPFGVAPAADGGVVVADAGDAPRIVRLAPDGRISSIAGGIRGFADGLGTAARFDTPSAIAIDAGGTIYVADTGNHAIRRVSPDGRVTTVAGDGIAGDADGAGHAARFNGPVGIAVDPGGRLIVADTYNDRLRAIDRDGRVTTIAGAGGAGAEDGPAADARFDTPCGVAVDTAGRIYVADSGNGAIRLLDGAGMVATLARDAGGVAIRPIGIAVDSRGAVFVSDERGRIMEFEPGGGARTLVGSLPGFRDGAAADARFRRLAGLALAGDGRLIAADAGNGLIRTVTARSRLTGLLPSSPLLEPGFDRAAFDLTPLLWPVAPMEGPHEIAGTMGEARGAEGAERFHAGMDVRIEQGTWVRAVRTGTVASPISTGDFASLNEWLRIGALSYVHVRAGRSRSNVLIDHDGFVPGYDDRGTLARVRIRRGTRVAAGDVIASVNPFNHVHLNVGWPGEEFNPLGFRLPSFEDEIAPTIAAGGITLYDDNWQPMARPRRQPPVLTGRIRIVVDAWDQSNGNLPNRRLGLYALGYEVRNGDGTPAPGFERPRETIEFDRLAIQPDAASLVYAPGSGIPFYRGRRTRFLYIVTNTLRGGAAAEGFWDTSPLPPGPYVLRIHARDVRGNQALANRDVRVIVGTPVSAGLPPGAPGPRP